MTDSDLAERLDAVERALTDDETDLAAVRERATLSAEVDRLEARVEELEAQFEELNAAVEAVRGYTGNVRAVNREVERRASAALAKAEALESAVDGASRGAGEGWTGESRADEAWTDEGRADGSRHGTANSGRVRNGTDSTGGDDPVGTTTVRNQDQWERRPSSGVTAHEDRLGATGQDGQPGAGEHETRRRVAACERRPTAIREPGESDESDEGSGTEQFIERVRDAL